MPRKPDSHHSIGFIAAPATRTDLLDWGPQPEPLAGASQSSGLLLWKSDDGALEAGLWVCTPGRWRLALPGDELCHFVAGRASYRADDGELLEVRAGSVVHFEKGWRGECTVHETIRNTYMLANASAPQSAPCGRLLQDPLHAGPAKDWGPVSVPLEGVSYTSGVLLHKGPGGHTESGVWVCTPGSWYCHVTSDELCHFLAGRCTYTHESGEVIEIEPDTLALFPQDWKGRCQVHETVRKVYMIR